ncbi:MAG TPA: ABC transporter permease [Conexibacter sp.]|jgi:ribose transport system permease protein
MSTVQQAAKPPVASTRAPGGALQTALGLQRRYPIMQAVALVAVFVYGAATLDGLASASSIRSILVLASLAGLAACGQTMLILMGGFDMSVSGFIVGGALVVTSLTGKYNISFGVALVGAIVAAGLMGAMAGQICHRFEIQPLIVTLATGAIAVGVVQVQTGGTLAGSSPAWLSRLTSPAAKTFGVGVPPLVVLWVVVTIAMSVFLHRTVGGRRLMATGANSRAAEFSLVRTRRVWTLAFAFSAVVAVLVGVLLAGFAGSVDATLGNPYLFQSVAAVIVGGTVFGGPGDYARTVLGALFLTTLTTVLIGHGASAADQQILYGAIILIAVAVYGRDRALRDRV